MRFKEGDNFTATGFKPGNPAKLRFTVKRVVAAGGQGWGYEVREKQQGWTAFAKTFHEEHTGALTAERTRWLARAGLDDPELLAPLYVIEKKNRVIGHVSRFIEGTSLSEIIYPKGSGQTGPPPTERRRLALDLARAVLKLHCHGISHGDLSIGNILIDSRGRLYLIDFDNFLASGPPVSQMQGTLLYTSPTVLRGMLPTKHTDIFSLSVLVHEILLGRHPIIPPDIVLDGKGKQKVEAMARSARWLDDPKHGNGSFARYGGAPVSYLPPTFSNLIRASIDCKNAPRANDFVQVLSRMRPANCRSCGNTNFFHDNERRPCGWCGKKITRSLYLRWKDGSMVLPPGQHVIGRRDLLDPDISRSHLTIQVNTRNVLVTNTSRNGTLLVTRSGTDKLPPNRMFKVPVPSQLRLGNVQLWMEWK